MHTHLCNQIKHPQLTRDNTLHVVGVISNPARYHSRYRLFKAWEERMLATPHVKLYVVEAAFGERAHEVTDPLNVQHLCLRTKQELWHKENMVNLGVKRLLPPDWRYMCWADCDVSWPNLNWAQECLQQLQHCPVVQPWHSCSDLGFYGQVLQTFYSFCHVHRLRVPKQCHPSQPYRYAHSGFAWACTRRFWENVGGLMDFPILGSADHHMAWAMINRVEDSVHGKMHDEFKRRAHEWQANAYRETGGTLGYVNTRIEHAFHGPKAKRQYRERWQILIDHAFNPATDLAYDEQGMLYVVGKPALLNDLHDYFHGRGEDEISS